MTSHLCVVVCCSVLQCVAVCCSRWIHACRQHFCLKDTHTHTHTHEPQYRASNNIFRTINEGLKSRPYFVGRYNRITHPSTLYTHTNPEYLWVNEHACVYVHININVHTHKYLRNRVSFWSFFDREQPHPNWRSTSSHVHTHIHINMHKYTHGPGVEIFTIFDPERLHPNWRSPFSSSRAPYIRDISLEKNICKHACISNAIYACMCITYKICIHFKSPLWASPASCSRGISLTSQSKTHAKAFANMEQFPWKQE